MRLKNIVVVVSDIDNSKKFYHDLFGLDVVLNKEGNVILTEGLVLQDKKIWEECIQKEIIQKNHTCELYFEERDMEAFAGKLERLYPGIEYLNPLMIYEGGRKVMRFYDPDGNLIEVGTYA